MTKNVNATTNFCKPMRRQA